MVIMEKTEKEEIETGDRDSRVYEVGYILVPTLAEEAVPAEYGNLKELVSSLGGNAISDEMPHKIELAYQMLKDIQNKRNKFESGYFGWMKFDMDPDSLSKLKEALTLSDKVIRFLITKTVRENTVAVKRMSDRREFSKKKPASSKTEDSVPVEINKEEVDKQIEALIAE